MSGEQASAPKEVQRTEFNGLDAVTLRHPTGATAVVTLHGANVVSWTGGGGNDDNLLFLSSKAVFNGKKAIRGGIPLVFPQFGDGLDPDSPLPAHGFARISKWALRGGGLNTSSFESAPFSGTVSADFVLSSTDVHQEGHASPWLNGALQFDLIFSVQLGPDALGTSLTIANTAPGETKVPFKYQALFHTYYSVPDSTAVQVALKAADGGDSVTIHDKMTPDNPIRPVEAPAYQTIDKEVDRIFHSIAPTVGLQASATRRFAIKVRQVAVSPATAVGPMDCVVWNPWVAKAQRMGDFGDEEYKTMVCVEPGLVREWNFLAPGQTVRMDQQIFVQQLPSSL